MATDLLAPPPAGSLSDLSTRFDELAARIRRVALIKGLGRLAFVAAFLCAIGLLADWLWVMPPAVRGGWLLVVLAAMGYTLWTAVLKPVFRKLTIAELAAIVETEYPELGERLTSAVELTDPTIPDDEKGSPLMREWLEAETLTSARQLDFRKAVSTRRAKKAGWIGGIALAMLLAPFLLMTSGYTSLWGRLITPWAAHELPAELYFRVPEGDRVVPRGEDLTIVALPPESVPRDKLPAAVELAWTTAAGEAARRPMQYDSKQKGFTVTLPLVFEGFEYIVTAERKRSERHTITVVDRPEITAFTLTITPPSYTGRPQKTVDGAVGNVTAFERSRVEAFLEFNKPLAAAEWLWQSAEEDAPNTPAALPFQLSEDRQSARLELLAANGWFSARVQDEHGLSNIEEPARNLTIVTDRPPELALSGQIGTTRARPDDAIELHARATDDFGVSALELHIETSNDRTEVLAVPPEELDSQEVEHVFPLDLAKFDLKDGESLKYRVRASDNRPVPGPQEVWSDERRIIIDPEAEPPGSREVAERQNELRDVLNQILEDLQKNRVGLETVKKAAESALNEEQPFENQAELTNLELKQSQIGERLEKLAARFGGHRLFANLVPETQRIAREPVTEATEHLQRAQSQEDLAEKSGSIEISQDAVAVAEADLQKLIARFDELAELERDLLVIPRLAGQAKRVADQAMDLADARDNPPTGETPEQKTAREQDLDQKEAALKEEREQLTAALDELLNHRPEILAAARKSALEQIAELSQQAGRLADRQDLLTESLKTDAEDAAKAAAPLAKRQSELVNKADELKAKAPKPDDTTGQPIQVDAVDPEELRRILEDLKAGDLDSAAQRQADVADRLDILAAELKKNQQLSADPQKAAEELAARQRELEKEILKAAKNRPDENAPASEKEVFQGQLRKLAEKQTGIQAGIAQLDAPAPHREEHQKALDEAREAVEKLIQSNAEQAAKEAKNAAGGLENLAKTIGTPEERRKQAEEAVETLRKKQHELGNDVAKAAEQSEDENRKADRLTQRQQGITEDLAKIDAPQTEELLQEAVRESVAALSDLKNDRLQDAEASQDRAEQSQADLAQKMAGKPTSREEVERLQKLQSEIRQKAETAAKNQDQNGLAEQAAAQTEQAERLKKLDTPAADLERHTAEAAAREAAKSLKDPGNKDQTGPALDRAAASLDQLQKTLTRKPDANPADAAEELRKRQNQLVKSAQAEAKKFKQNQTLPSPEDRKKRQDELAGLTRDTKRLRAGRDASQQKQEALEALQKAGEAQEQLEELIKEKEEKKPSTDSSPQNDPQDDELQRLIQENAEQQKQAAEALDRFKQELSKDETQETLHNELNEIDEEAEKLAREKSSKPAQPETKEVEQLARQARALEREIEQLRKERTAPQGKQVAQTEPAEQSPPAEPAPPKSSEKPGAKSQDPNPSRANDQQTNDQNMKPSDPNNPDTNPSDPNDSDANDSEPNPSDPKDSDANNSRAEQSPALPTDRSPENQSPAPDEENERDQEKPRELSDPSAAPPENPMAEESGSEANDPAANQQRAEQTEPSLAESQAELAGKSAELAVKIAREHGAESTASRRATEAARKAGQASEQAGDGALEQAAKTAMEAAETTKSATDELTKDPAAPATGEASELAKEALEQAEAQTALAKELEKAAKNPTARRAARKAGQERLTEASKQLADRLDEAARELTSQPLKLEQPGEKTKAAGEAANRGAEQMKQAKTRAEAGDSGQAAQSGEQAAEALRRAAGEPPAPPDDTPENTLVPGDLADQVAEARRRLEEAEKHLQNGQPSEQSPQTAGDAPSSSPRDDSKPMEAGENQQATPEETNPGQESNPADPEGQTGESQAAQGQPGPGQAGQDSSGKQSAMAQSAQKLQQAAQSLSQAARQLGSGNTPGQSESPGQSQIPSEIGEQGRPSGAGSRGGSNSPQSLQALEAELQRQNREVWGQLPGKLRTEILEGNKKPTGGDYARLIELYSQELLKKQQAEPEASSPR